MTDDQTLGAWWSEGDDQGQAVAASGRPQRTIGDAVADALDRGAISESRIPYWLSLGDAHADTVDALAGTSVLAAGHRVSRPFATAGGTPVSAAAGDANPLLDQLRRDKPALVQAAMAEDPNPPKLFGSRDLPQFTASGLDPSVLATVPWQLRRAMADAPTLRDAYALSELAEDEVKLREFETNRHNLGYVEAMRTWLVGSGRTPADQGGTAKASAGRDFYTTEQLHRELFGPRSGPYRED